MSRMIPPTVHPDVKSSAEKKIFRLLRDADGTSDFDWIGFMAAGAPHSEYIPGYIVLRHATDGSVTLEAGLPAGRYDVRMFWDDSYTLGGASWHEQW